MYIFIFCNENLQEYKGTAIFLMVPISSVAELIALQLALCLLPYAQKLQPHQQGKMKDLRSWQQVLCVLKPVIPYEVALQLLGMT